MAHTVYCRYSGKLVSVSVCLSVSSSSTHTVGRGLWQLSISRGTEDLCFHWSTSDTHHLRDTCWQHHLINIQGYESTWMHHHTAQRILGFLGQTGPVKDLLISQAFRLVVTLSIYYDVIGLQGVEPEMWCRWWKRLPVCVCVLHLSCLSASPPSVCK